MNIVQIGDVWKQKDDRIPALPPVTYVDGYHIICGERHFDNDNEFYSMRVLIKRNGKPYNGSEEPTYKEYPVYLHNSEFMVRIPFHEDVLLNYVFQTVDDSIGMFAGCQFKGQRSNGWFNICKAVINPKDGTIEASFYIPDGYVPAVPVTVRVLVGYNS